MIFANVCTTVCVFVTAPCAWKVCEIISMEMMNIEKVVVGSGVRSSSAEIKSEPVIVPRQPCEHSDNSHIL